MVLYNSLSSRFRGVNANGRQQGGYTILAAIFAIAILAAGVSEVGQSISQSVRRDNEQQLLMIGLSYARAIDSYRGHATGKQITNPRTLDDLLHDRRFIGVVRHLRRPYGDPVSGGAAFGLMRDGSGNIEGVYSTSSEMPFRSTAADLGLVKLPAAQRYSEWKFRPISNLPE
jgi:type II secretory pathway pseudopilin PulG